jgi:hypothetical protein
MHFVGGGAVKLKVACQHGDVVARRGHGLAGVAGFKLGQLVVMIKDRLRQLDQQSSTLKRAELAPGAAQGLACGVDGKVDVVRAAAGDAVKGLSIGWCRDTDRAFVLGCDPLAADEHLAWGDDGSQHDETP